MPRRPPEETREDLRLPAPPAPLFLARQAYRRRRLGDAARMLPVVGVVLFFLPILWQPAQSPEADTAAGAIWLFSAWAVIIGISFLLSRRLGRDGDDGRRDRG